MNNSNVADWLKTSSLLFNSVRPADAGVELFGIGMQPADFANLVDRETQRVDHALTAMATAAGEAEVVAILAQLERDTVIALFSRWARYTQAWQAMLHQSDPQLWMPPRDVWRAVFLAMTGENVYSTAAARSLWPEAF